ncbi:hypothetical protein [Inquilinus sp. CA228]|uniref:hypothetical protein n=1 Tax=Inquilinus sp. CA228 TaxID=3455609 RepID=UPI003F8D7EF5
MRTHLNSILIMICATIVAGCGSFKKIQDAELRSSGGIVGKTADNIFPAKDKSVQLYRASIAMALIAAAGSKTVASVDDSYELTRAIAGTSAQINDMRGLIFEYHDCYSMNTICKEYPQQFEGRIPDLENRLYRQALAALPRDQFGDLKDDIISQSYISFAINLAKATGTTLLAAHQMAATERSVLEGLARVVARARKDSDAKFATVEQASAYIGEHLSGRNTPERTDLDPLDQDFDLIFKLTGEACSKIANQAGGRQNEAISECAKVILIPRNGVSKVVSAVEMLEPLSG